MLGNSSKEELINIISQELLSKYSHEGIVAILKQRYKLNLKPSTLKADHRSIKMILSSGSYENLQDLYNYLNIGEKRPNGEHQGTDTNRNNAKDHPQTWIGVVFWLLTNRKRLFLSLIICLFIGALLIGVGRILGYDVFASIFPRLAKVRIAELNNPSLQYCIDEAQKREKAYVVLSVTELVEIRDTYDSLVQYRTATVRNIYTLLMLKDVSKQNSTEFFEAFTSDNRAVIERWYGSERETSDGMGSTYDVIFDAKKGETKTIITGAVYKIPLPLPNGRSAFGQNSSLGNHEDTWGYPNVIDGDIIHEITIIIWSPTTKLIPVGQAAKRLTSRTVKGSDVHVNEPPDGKDIRQRSLSASWINLFPGEEVGIQFTW